MATVTERARGGGRQRRLRQRVIDTDVHVAPACVRRWFPERWRDFPYQGRWQTEADLIRHRPYSSRTDTFPPGGGPPASDPAFMVEQLLDRYDIDFAVVNVLGAGCEGSIPQAYTEASAAAANECLAEEFFGRDSRWLGTLHVPYESPGRYAVRELERWQHEPRFVQVITLFRTEKPLGDPKYWDLYEACEAMDLPVAIHVGGLGGHTVTAAGWPSFYFEDHAGYPQAVPVHIASLVCEGVLDRFPGLRFVVMEGGWTWVPAFAARFDKSWRVLRDEVPDLQHRPSEYVRDRFWFTTQPMEEPDKPAWLWQIMTSAGLENRIMFSTDYPHWDFDSPTEVIPRSLDPGMRDKLFYGNAEELYAPRAASYLEQHLNHLPAAIPPQGHAASRDTLPSHVIYPPPLRHIASSPHTATSTRTRTSNGPRTLALEPTFTWRMSRPS